MNPATIPPAALPDDPRSLDLRILAVRIWAQRGRVVLVTVVAGLLGLLLAFVLPKWYRASAVILPPEEGDLATNLAGMSLALSKFPALGEFGEYTTPADIYKAILKSRTVQSEVVDRFDLMRVYRQKSRENTLRMFGKHTSVKLAIDGTIGVTVEDRDPKRAAAMAMAMLDALDHYNIEKRNTQAHRTRLFLQQRVASTDSLLRLSESALRHYQETHHTAAPIALNPGDFAGAANLMARRSMLEMRLGVLRGYLRENNEQVVQTRSELSQLERQIGTLPTLQTELARLIRDNKVQEQIYLLLTAELEQARVQELRNTPTVSVLDPPVPPERHSRPRKSLFAVVAGLLGGAGAIIVVALREPSPVSRED
jgi:tyrosine-protein kinase Etk/Wzc